MGLIYSAFCMISFCFERVLTWACCACALMTLLSIIMLLMVYGISIGYGYAQQELAAFAKKARADTSKHNWVDNINKGVQPPHTPYRPFRGRRSGPAPRDQPNLRAASRNPMELSNHLYDKAPNAPPGVQGYPKTSYDQKTTYSRDFRDASYPQKTLDIQETIYPRFPYPDSLEAPYAQENRVQSAEGAQKVQYSREPYARDASVQGAVGPREDLLQSVPVPREVSLEGALYAEEIPKSQETSDALDAPDARNTPYPRASPVVLEAPLAQDTQDAQESTIAQNNLLAREIPEATDAIQKTYSEKKPSPIIILPTERPPQEPEMLPHEQELARKLIGRLKRSKMSRHLAA